jgi:hypothetical protein
MATTFKNGIQHKLLSIQEKLDIVGMVDDT